MKRIFRNLLFLFGGLTILFIIIEVTIRTFAPQPKYYAPQGLFMADKLLGYKLTPNFDESYTTPENTVGMKINSKGLRDYEYGEKRGIRILCLGDSFVMGVGVELEDTFLALLERDLNLRENGKYFEVINAGVQGYGTDQELTFLKFRGFEYQPDLVILGFYPNDIIDNIMPNFSVVNGYLAMEERGLSTQEEIKRPLLDYKMILMLVKNEIHTFRFFINRLNNNPVFKRYFLKAVDNLKKSRKNRIEIYSKNLNQIESEGWKKTKEYLSAINEIVKENSAKLLIVYIPERLQVYQTQWEHVKKQWNITEKDYDIAAPAKILSTFCKENNIPFLDLMPTLKSRVKKGDDLYYELDPHFSVKGNEVVAQLIYRKIIEDNLIDNNY